MIGVSLARRGGRSLAAAARRAGMSTGVYADEMHRSWTKDPSSVDASWDVFFRSGDFAPSGSSAVASSGGAALSSNGTSADDVVAVTMLIRAFQSRGHEAASLDPLDLLPKAELKVLNPATYGFHESEWDRPLQLGALHDMEGAFDGLLGNPDLDGDGETTMRELMSFLETVYCGAIGAEYMHINGLRRVNWIRERCECDIPSLSKEDRLGLLSRLAHAELFESLLATKFNTAKRFGVEGLESIVPGMLAMVETAADHNVEQVVIGMPHRGRLNVLQGVMRKPKEMIFKEFQGIGQDVEEADDWGFSGDVKYHLGTSNDRIVRKRNGEEQRMHLTLLPNPSHLEAVAPLVLGKARAKADLMGDEQCSRVLPVILHGDAAFAGQGIVYETMQLARVPSYYTGGSIHIVCNNQIGFTTNPDSARSTPYSTDLGKAFSAPIFHVNSDKIEEVARVFDLATAYRQRWASDVVIDLVGYRRHGHNEIDQPLFTQPQMYETIAAHGTPLAVYKADLLAKHGVTQSEIDVVIDGVQAEIEASFAAAPAFTTPPTEWFAPNSEWGEMKVPVLADDSSPLSGISDDVITRVGDALVALPEGFKAHRGIERVLTARSNSLKTGEGIDWATAEAFAMGSLMLEGNKVRLAGQDVQRGTFSHRHAVVRDQRTGEAHTFLDNVAASEGDAPHAAVDFCNSPLNEFGVLGFELGYSMESPKALVMWEAQFGDFANGAQIIFDNFLCSMEAKWKRQSGLVCLLPHGYQGAGPEHSSCRIERFLQNSDEDAAHVPLTTEERHHLEKRANWQVVNPSTPANYFHALRRQLHREYRKPLIVASQKALLRLPASFSSVADLEVGTKFERVLPESFPETLKEPEEIRKVVMCSGKLYYELLQARVAGEVDDVAIVRFEQLLPFPFDHAAKVAETYPNADFVWAQEEPKNMGGWEHVHERFMNATGAINGVEKRLNFIGRKPMASPAEGWGAAAAAQQTKIIEEAVLG